ncbi:hypothetical protein E1301_Tti009038 [Triplophysa tibetana]|uniref:Uncharacterized protein n=1 Tax=Triplophysa tibetana TaxID=1572043 RepID=A0A5A9P4K0_9TELE|nr:hypothetical protein E1301_Tti009038 [Triplophysa tibetana]
MIAAPFFYFPGVKSSPDRRRDPIWWEKRSCSAEVERSVQSVLPAWWSPHVPIGSLYPVQKKREAALQVRHRRCQLFSSWGARRDISCSLAHQPPAQLELACISSVRSRLPTKNYSSTYPSTCLMASGSATNSRRLPGCRQRSEEAPVGRSSGSHNYPHLCNSGNVSAFFGDCCPHADAFKRSGSGNLLRSLTASGRRF